MAAADKLIPTALTLANNLKGTKYSSGGTYKLPGKNNTLFNNVYTDAIQFFASIYAKELNIADANTTWNQRMVDGSNVQSVFTPNRNIHNINLGMLVAVSEAEWNELQIAISRAFNIVYPLDISGTTSGSAINVTITNAGGPGPNPGFYPALPAGNLTGVGVGATFDVLVTLIPLGVSAVSCVNPGSGYLVGDTFNFPTMPGSIAEVMTIASFGGSSVYNPEQILAYNDLMGVFENTTSATSILFGADGSNLGVFAQGEVFANAWNTTKIAYDASIGVETSFIAPILKPTGASKFYYRFTGVRRWFGFDGYDSL